MNEAALKARTMETPQEGSKEEKEKARQKAIRQNVRNKNTLPVA
jgi:hypothetical protein